jgi:phage baseplate assembly protein gpV
MSGFHTATDTIKNTEDYSKGYYVGVVVANNDPLGLGRVQANVSGLYDNTAGPIPWIGPHDRQSPFGYGTSAKNPYGVYGVPPIGATIKVELQNGDEHKALYSTLHTQPNANPSFMTPNLWGFQDPDGNIVVYDIQAHTYHFGTAGGLTVDIDAQGNRITATDADTTNTKGNWSINVQGNASIVASGNFTMQAGGTATYTAASHQFNGPINASSTIAAQGDITDQVGTGNSQSMAAMRTTYNTHRHHYDDNGSDNVTDVPFPLT